MKYMPTVMTNDFDKYFYNRVKDIEKINTYLSLLEKGIPNQLLVTGYRGVGKTFLLKKILNEQPDNYLTTYIDLSYLYGRKNSKLTEMDVMKEIFNSLMDTINNDDKNMDKIKTTISNFIKKLKLKSYKISETKNILKIPLPDIKDDYDKLSKFVMELPQKIVDASDDIDAFVIVIDEFQLLKTLDHPESFFWLIRSSTQVNYNVSYIFTGSLSRTAEIIEMINGQNGAFAGRMLQINIDPFTKEETKNYINEKSDNLKFTEEAFSMFYNCTRGIPAYINSLCNILPNDRVCTPEIIKNTITLNIDQVSIMWLYVWGRLNNHEKSIVKLLVELKELSWTELMDSTSYSSATLNKYLDSLSNNGIIETNLKGKYILTDNMLKTWLKIRYKHDKIYPL